GKRWGIRAFEARGDRPVFGRLEGLDLAFTLADDAHGDRLHAARRQAATDLLPQDWADLVADEAVEDAARLLRFVEIAIELLRIADGLLHRAFGDLVEQHAVDVFLVALAEGFGDVPGDRLALTIRIGRQIDVLLAVQHLVLGSEVVLDVDTQLALGQVHDVPDRCLHLEVSSQILLERARFGGRFDDQQIFRHTSYSLAGQGRTSTVIATKYFP